MIPHHVTGLWGSDISLSFSADKNIDFKYKDVVLSIVTKEIVVYFLIALTSSKVFLSLCGTVVHFLLSSGESTKGGLQLL